MPNKNAFLFVQWPLSGAHFGAWKRFGCVFLGMLFSAASHAIEYPPPTSPDLLRQRACLVMHAQSSSVACELIGITGPVSRVVYGPANDPSYVYHFDRQARLSRYDFMADAREYRHTTTIYTYGDDGKVISANGKNERGITYQYKNGLLTGLIDSERPYVCNYSFVVQDVVTLEATCNDKVNKRIPEYKWRIEMDLHGRLLKADKNATAWYLGHGGTLGCKWIEEQASAVSQCSDGNSIYLTHFDARGRPVRYTEKPIGRRWGELVLRFSYFDDKYGNWIKKVVHYEQRAFDLINTRRIEYYE